MGSGLGLMHTSANWKITFVQPVEQQLHAGVAMIPFLLGAEETVVVKSVPTATCEDCHEPFMSSKVTVDIMALLSQPQTPGSEVSVISFPDDAVS